MAASRPGETDDDALSHGRETSRSFGSGLLVGVAAVALAAGYFLGGGQIDLLQSRDPASASVIGPLSAGAIEPIKIMSGSHFVIPVFNSGDDTVTATLISIDGFEAQVETAPRRIPSEVWARLYFSAPEDCGDSTPDAVSGVRLRVSGESAQSDTVEVALPDNGAATLLEYHKAVCAPRVTMQPTELSGIWQVQKIYGQPIDLQAVTLLMRFTADGRLVIDHEGELFTGRPDVRGRYRLDNALLTTQVESGEGCAPGEGATWRAAKTSPDGLSLAWVNGTCPNDGQDDVWILRRLLDEAGFP